MEEKSIKFGIELSEQLRSALGIAAATRPIQLKEAARETFSAWIEIPFDIFSTDATSSIKWRLVFLA